MGGGGTYEYWCHWNSCVRALRIVTAPPGNSGPTQKRLDATSPESAFRPKQGNGWTVAHGTAVTTGLDEGLGCSSGSAQRAHARPSPALAPAVPETLEHLNGRNPAPFDEGIPLARPLPYAVAQSVDVPVLPPRGALPGVPERPQSGALPADQRTSDATPPPVLGWGPEV